MRTIRDNAAVNKNTVRRILRYARPYWGWFLLALGLITLTVRLELLQPAIIEYATDTYVGSHLSDLTPSALGQSPV